MSKLSFWLLIGTLFLATILAFVIIKSEKELKNDLIYGAYRIYSYDNKNNCILFADSNNILNVVRIPYQKEFEFFLNTDTLRLKNVTTWQYINYIDWLNGEIVQYRYIGKPLQEILLLQNN